MNKIIVLKITLITALTSNQSEASSKLNILSWHGYTDSDIVSIFEKKYDVNINITYVTNDKQLRENIENSDHKFDIVVLNTSELKRYVRLNAVLPIDISKVSNSKWLSNQFTPLNRNAKISQHGTLYGIPFTYSSMGIIYHKDRVNVPPSSWNAFWSTTYDKKVLNYDGGDTQHKSCGISA